MSNQLSPVEGVLAVLDDGAVTGTNKLGLLLALLDLVPETGPDGLVSFDDLAAKSIEIHWDHARPFGGRVLRQVKSGNREYTATVLAILDLQAAMRPTERNRAFESSRPLIEPNDWSRALKRVRRMLQANPVDKLQNLPGGPQQFLYEIGDDGIRLLPGAREELQRFGPVLRPLIEAKFVDFVMAANRARLGDPVDLQLREHLFGSERHMPGSGLRHDLWLAQGRTCLYSGAALPDPAAGAGGRVAVDHVVPWSRHRLSTVENLVLAANRVNGEKRNFLLGLRMLQRWFEHLRRNGEALVEIAEEHRWPVDLARTIRISQACYAAHQSAIPVWEGPGIGATPSDPKPLANLHAQLRTELEAP